MPTTLASLWESIIEARANFYDFLLLLNEFSVRFFESDFAISLFGQNASFTSVFNKYIWLPFLLILFSLAEAFYGRRLLPILKLLIGFITGFSIGAVYIAPLVSRVIDLDHLTIGIAFGIVVAVFKTPLYYTIVTSVLFYIFYAQFINLLNFSKFWAFAFSAIAVILVLLFLLKWVEYIGTALIGGWLFAATLALIIKLPLEDTGALFKVLHYGISALGLLVQLKLRKIRHSKKNKQNTPKSVA